MARIQKPAPLRIHTVSLTPHDGAILTDLQQTCTDQLGRTISASAIVRALLRLAERQSPPVADLVTMVSGEVDAGRMWGRKPKKPHR